MPVTAEDLRQLDPDALALLLALRPDALGPADPRSLDEVAARLNHHASLERAVRTLDTPTLQVARALVLVGCHDDPTTLPQFLRLSTAAELEALELCLEVLDHLLLREDCGCLADGLAERWIPYGLGPHVLRALGWRTNDRLREALRAWGEPTDGNKLDLVERLAAVLTDGERLHQALTRAPEQDRRLLADAVAGDGMVALGWSTYGPRRGPGAWLVERGLTDADRFGPDQLPAQVTIALRGQLWRPPFDWQEPLLPTTTLAREQVDRDAAAAALRGLRLVTDLVREAGRAPLRLNRDGTLGKRERARLAGLLRAEPAHVTFAVALAYAAGFVGHLDDRLSPTAEASEWAGMPPAQRHAQVVLTWLGMQQEVLADPGTTWWPASHLTSAGSKHVLLRVLAAEPDRAAVDQDDLVRLCAWVAPVRLGAEDGAALVAGALAEATALGVVGTGALSSLGHALLSGDDAVAVLERWLGSAAGTARLQADLTAVVLGDPSERLARVLDLMATRESSDQATTWRFDARSLAGALDAGHSADGLLGALAAVAEGEVPQPLTYLVRDTARRHGVLRLGEAACYLRSEDHALLAEVAADSRLRGLGLRLLAPGVLVADAPAGRALERIRAAGYLPVHEGADGTAVVPDGESPLAEVSDYVSETSLRLQPPGSAPSPHDEAVLLLALPDRAPSPLVEFGGSVVDSESMGELFSRQVRDLGG
ncbi:helicase-associated domain-containing protein [Aquipuribacter sp. MA13-6]|uniref:helicase-associated domain-containing protein n=1 Tax=unclassified Aquipuribacter TaxID=2635084 RepID=UPI003EEA0D87